MKRLLHICLISLISFSAAAALPHENNAADQNKNLKAFIQVWGLIKYHHPASVNGHFEADRVFLENVGTVKQATPYEFNKIVLTIMSSLKADPVYNGASSLKRSADGLYQNIDLGWIKDKIYAAPLASKLTALSSAYNSSGKHFYMPSVHYESMLPNEKIYADYNFDQQGMNLLALAKAWNAIEYLFPYKYAIGKDWKKVLDEMIPLFLGIKNRQDYERAVLSLEVAVNDTHAEGFIKEMKAKSAIFNLKYYPPFDYRVYGRQILIREFLTDSLQRISQLRRGDLIISMNGLKVSRWLASRYNLHPASNIAVKNRALSTQEDGSAYLFSGIENKSLSLQVLRKGRLLAVKLELLDRKNPADMNAATSYFRLKYAKEKQIKGYEDIDEETGLFRAGYFFDKDLPNGEEEIARFCSRLRSKKSLIFDMRGYPQAPGLFYMFIPMALGRSSFKFARYYAADLSYPGAFVQRKEMELYLSASLKPDPNSYTGKIVILTDEHTQSMGEWYTMMLSQLNKNTTIIGSQTAGADGDLKKISLPGGYQFIFTGNGIFYPDGRKTQRIGIRPDIQFSPSSDDLVNKADAQLERAMEFIKTGK